MFTTKHFVTGEFKSHASFVDDKTYSLILDNIVKATVDIQVTRSVGPSGETIESSSGCAGVDGAGAEEEGEIQVLLGKRVGLPHDDWWLPGGRMMPGERIDQTVKRVLKRELGVELQDGSSDQATTAAPVVAAGKAVTEERPDPRVRTVTHYTFSWDTRTQEPLDHGTSDVSLIARVHLTPEEVAQVQRKPSEYSYLLWSSPSMLLRVNRNYTSSSDDDEEEEDDNTSEAAKEETRTAMALGLTRDNSLHPALVESLSSLEAMIAMDAVEKLLKEKQKMPTAGVGTDSSSEEMSKEKMNDANAKIVAQLQRYMELKQR